MPHRAALTKSGAAVHPVAAIDLPGLKPAHLDGVAEPIFDRIAHGDLLVDESYQRSLSARSLKLIRSIVEGGTGSSSSRPWSLSRSAASK